MKSGIIEKKCRGTHHPLEICSCVEHREIYLNCCATNQVKIERLTSQQRQIYDAYRNYIKGHIQEQTNVLYDNFSVSPTLIDYGEFYELLHIVVTYKGGIIKISGEQWIQTSDSIRRELIINSVLGN